jgi:hypothetical protein
MRVAAVPRVVAAHFLGAGEQLRAVADGSHV